MALFENSKKYFIIENFNSECQKTELLLRCLLNINYSYRLTNMSSDTQLSSNVEEVSAFSNEGNGYKSIKFCQHLQQFKSSIR